MQRFSPTPSASKKSTDLILTRLAQQKKDHSEEPFFKQLAVALLQNQTKHTSFKIATLMSIFNMVAATDSAQYDSSSLTSSERGAAALYVLPIIGGAGCCILTIIIYMLCRENCRTCADSYTVEAPRVRSVLPSIENTLHEESPSSVVKEMPVTVTATPPLPPPTNAERLEKMITQLTEAGIDYEIIYPEHFLCAITEEIMTDPVIVDDGQSYEKAQILQQKESGNANCPLNTSIKITYMHDNLGLKLSIREFVEIQEKTVAELIANKNKMKMSR